ncbi:MAG: GNAT family N-acetyltransferase [Proteobacteria bacterium]|uniref:GNAT family N-acetyltransferase n=1 Tax=Rudaea sp. TaxID=2136325 RepID=UPI003783EB94|nr:GNAT family N-acetyltransferase [Pseudomonadota bacterium]
MTTAVATIETTRLLLRPIAREDFDAWAAFMADEESARFIGGAQPRAAAWRGFLTMAGAWTIQGFSMFSVIEKASGRWVGRIGPWMPEGWPGTEVGWGLAREATGKGFATEAATAAIDWAFANLGWSEVIHCIEPANTKSAAVAARLGSRRLRQAALPPPFSDKVCDIWGQSHAEWMARRR